jgi:hypothetical protein
MITDMLRYIFREQNPLRVTLIHWNYSSWNAERISLNLSRWQRHIRPIIRTWFHTRWRA